MKLKIGDRIRFYDEIGNIHTGVITSIDRGVFTVREGTHSRYTILTTTRAKIIGLD